MSLAALILDKDSIKDLDASGLTWLMQTHTDYQTVTEYAATLGYWNPGDGTPPLDLTDPATAQAAGRCAANRTRYGSVVSSRSVHPYRCGWCDYPMDALLQALDHAAWRSRYIVTEYVTWPTKDGHYTRSTGRGGNYDHPAWQAFFRGATSDTADLSPSDMERERKRRADAIEAAAAYERVPA